MFSWKGFWVACAVVAVLLLHRIWQLHPLYIDPALRSHVQVKIKLIADDRGWVRSGISLQHVRQESIRFTYRDYHRGSDQITCYTLELSTSLLAPCESSS